MQQKNIGAFVSVLRKANGMTQKELALRLNVTDKSVSRWECGDGLPDLALIPVIAEVFGITCDELLAGERNNTTAEQPSTTNSTTPTRAKKQRARLVSDIKNKFINQTLIAYGFLALAFVTAIICNNVFLRASLGGFLGLIFAVVAVLCELVFWNNAMHSLTIDDEETENTDVTNAKQILFSKYIMFYRIAFATIASLLPLIFFAQNSNWGIDLIDYFLIAAIFIAVSGIIFKVFALHFFWKWAIAKKIHSAEDAKVKKILFKCKLKHQSTILFAVLSSITFLAQLVYLNAGVKAHATPLIFTEKEPFIELIEQKTPNNDEPTHTQEFVWFPSVFENSDNVETTAPELVIDGPIDETRYFLENGNLISYEEAHKTEVTDPNGNLLFTYQDYNKEVEFVNISFISNDGTYSDFPTNINVYMKDDWALAQEKYYQGNFLITLLYFIWFILANIYYFIKLNTKSNLNK